MSDDGNLVLGQTGYEAYGSAANWKTFDGRPMPKWIELGASEVGRETQRRWEAAAVAIAAALAAAYLEGVMEGLAGASK